MEVLPALMGNASRPLTNATDSPPAEMEAMRPLRHVAPTVRRWTGGLPAPMENASGTLTNVTENATAKMGAMKLDLCVAEDVPMTQPEAKQPPS